MCWIDALLDFWFGDRGLSDGAEGPEKVTPTKGLPRRQGPDTSASSLSPLPDPPEMYLRPELIPIKELDGAAVEEAERVLRR